MPTMHACAPCDKSFSDPESDRPEPAPILTAREEAAERLWRAQLAALAREHPAHPALAKTRPEPTRLAAWARGRVAKKR
jgi:hypothetical protein